jgi:type I restriction enzyme S subunit
MDYTEIALKECCSISDGDHLPPPKSEKGIPFITISNINVFNRLDLSDTMFVPQEYYDSLSDIHKVQTGDILYSVVGSFGKPVYIDEDIKIVFQRHIAVLRPNGKVDGKYVYYTMLNSAFYKAMDKYAIGCSQRTITLDVLRNAKIKIPSAQYQCCVVKLLSIIDKKININNAINDNLSFQSTMVA